MIAIRKSDERGHSLTSWLDSWHTFSFSDYYDPAFNGFKNLRVINEDRVKPGMGFGRHGHRDMEIISYVINGVLSHQDSMGNGSSIQHGEIQCMSAGTGVEHSEFNHSQSDTLHFLQIWIIPAEKGLTPSYQQRPIPNVRNKFILLASPHRGDSVIHINQDAFMYGAHLDAGKVIQYEFDGHRAGWLQVVSGEVLLNGQPLVAGDGAQVSEIIELQAVTPVELLLFDL